MNAQIYRQIQQTAPARTHATSRGDAVSAYEITGHTKNYPPATFPQKSKKPTTDPSAGS